MNPGDFVFSVIVIGIALVYRGFVVREAKRLARSSMKVSETQRTRPYLRGRLTARDVDDVAMDVDLHMMKGLGRSPRHRGAWRPESRQGIDVMTEPLAVWLRLSEIDRRELIEATGSAWDWSEFSSLEDLIEARKSENQDIE
jgi:hypothetical protein